MKNRTCHDSLAPFARTAVKVATSLALIGALAGCAATNGGETVDSLMRERARLAETRHQARAADAGAEAPAAADADALPVLSGKLSLADAVTLALANNRSLKI